ncbi:MAG: ISNCY family transposase [Candidatus Krumholzibacteria bacterium]|nr:ISNCY family transposase [Candidatus Krumholzibacteria bacterium]
MAEQDILRMRACEIKRYHIVGKVLDGDLTQREAAEMAGISERQMRRVVRRVRDEGERGVIHLSRGRASNRRYPESFKRRVLGAYRRQYGDFGPTLACEKLSERDGIEVSVQTLRNWLIEVGLWEMRRRRRRFRSWRERKAHTGEMVQMDGSHHEWLEDRGPKLVLMSYIDDATGRYFGRFYDYEGTIPAMESFRRYVRRFGVPVCLYLDKHTTYKSNKESTIEERLRDEKPLSQFERAMKELGVTVIHAHSPQAKGRIERSYRTLQDRLVKDLRLAGASSIDEANAVLERYLRCHNRRFTQAPAQAGDLHRPLPEGVDLGAVLSIQTRRSLRNDRTVAHHNRLFQVTSKVLAKQVVVEERVSGAFRIRLGERYLNYRRIHQQPQTKTAASPSKPRGPRKSSKPAQDHPWRRSSIVAADLSE